MPTLMLLRHAKSDWDDPKMDDHDRPLNARGRRDAPRMGAYLHKRKWEPAQVLCSTSVRTRETWSLIARELGRDPTVRFERALYLASCASLLSALRNAPPSVPVLMLIGHNPGIQQLALALTSVAPAPQERERADSLRRKFPTCALAILEFSGAWRELAPGAARLRAFVRPKDIDEG